MDINPSANDKLHTRVVEILSQDEKVDGIVVGLDPLSPAMQTLPEGLRKGESLDSENSIARLMPALVTTIDKPVIGVVDSGRLYDPMVDALEKGGVPIFRSSDRAVGALAKYIHYRLYTERIRKDS